MWVFILAVLVKCIYFFCLTDLTWCKYNMYLENNNNFGVWFCVMDNSVEY